MQEQYTLSKNRIAAMASWERAEWIKTGDETH